MPRQIFIDNTKKKIDNKTIDRADKLEAHLNDWAKDDEERRILTEYFESKYPRVMASFSPTITSIDYQQLGASPFEENKESYDDFSPQYWFQYFWAEMKKEKLASAETSLGLEAVQLLFNKVQDSLLSRGFRLNLKDELRPTKGPPASSGAAPTFGMSVDAARTWNKALTNLLLIGFKRVSTQRGSPSLPTPTETALLENDFVSSINKDAFQLRIFWRADARGKDAFSGGAKRSVDDEGACAKYGLKQPWHPFSSPENTKYMWFRRGQADNDFYTVVSVTTDLSTACTFPLIDERRAYQMPLKPPAEWTAVELRQFQGNLVEVEVEGSLTSKVLIGTKTNVFMLALNDGVVMDTQGAGAKYRGEVKGFPEAGVTGYPFEAFMGDIPIVRAHHGPTNPAGFTAFLDPTTKPTFYLTESDLRNRFGESGASRILDCFKNVGIHELTKKTTAWSSHGATTPEVALNVKRLVSFPISPSRLEGFIKDKK